MKLPHRAQPQRAPWQDPNVNPITPIPITDVPNNTEYAVPSPDRHPPGYLQQHVHGPPGSLRLEQHHVQHAAPDHRDDQPVSSSPGGPKYSTQVSRAVIPATDSVNGLLSMGEVTLPVKDYIRYNDQRLLHRVRQRHGHLGQVHEDVLMLDTLGQTWLVNIDPGQL